MNKSESRYFGTAAKMDEALIACLEKKDLEYVTVKEICERAGVNRSTFYLHYENIGDLLDECVEYTNEKCFERYSSDLKDVKKRLNSDRAEDSVFVSPEYLRPYFEFVKQNKRLYTVVLQHRKTFKTDSTFLKIFDSVFSPAMDRFNVAESEKQYIVRFYLGGITSIASEWVGSGCKDSVETVVGLCMRCIWGWKEGKRGEV